jgi:hypothetical protein
MRCGHVDQADVIFQQESPDNERVLSVDPSINMLGMGSTVSVARRWSKSDFE